MSLYKNGRVMQLYCLFLFLLLLYIRKNQKLLYLVKYTRQLTLKTGVLPIFVPVLFFHTRKIKKKMLLQVIRKPWPTVTCKPFCENVATGLRY